LRRTLERRTRRLVLNLLATFANKLIYRRHCFPLILRRDRYSARKKARACLFPELVRQSAQAAALLKLFRDVLSSLSGGCGSWLPLSRNFSVASQFKARRV
jgi:hypothetical protein